MCSHVDQLRQALWIVSRARCKNTAPNVMLVNMTLESKDTRKIALVSLAKENQHLLVHLELSPKDNQGLSATEPPRTIRHETRSHVLGLPTVDLTG